MTNNYEQFRYNSQSIHFISFYIPIIIIQVCALSTCLLFDIRAKEFFPSDSIQCLAKLILFFILIYSLESHPN